MNALSLFDGMSCGRLALDRAGIEVHQYYASELDKCAIQVSQANYPETIQLGDVIKWRDWDIDWSSIDLLIGGSPCQGFSFAGKQLAFDDPRSKLFFVYVAILNHIRSVNPNVKFLLENVKMKKEYLGIISDQLGVEPVFINSALVSAQNRQRYYWANWGFVQPEDRGIVLADILEREPKNVTVMSDKFTTRNAHILRDDFSDKAKSLSAMEYVKNGRQGDYISMRPAAIRGRYIVDGKQQDEKMLTAGLTQQTLEVKSDNKTNALTTVQKDNVITPMAPGRYPLATSAGRNESGDRVLRVKGEKVPPITARYYKGVKSDGAPFIYHGDKEKGDIFDYEADKRHYRKLTPIECERLQTVPDNYTAHVSNTQRYKMLGNGWTVDVIAHILKGIKLGD